MLRSYEQSASEKLTPDFSYHPSTQKTKHKNNNRILSKAGPITLIFSAIIAFAALFGGGASQLGFHAQELITTATSRDYGTYQMLSRATTRQILKGEYRLTDKFKSRLEAQGFTVTPKSNGYDLEFNGTVASSDNFDDIINTNPEFREAFTKAKRGRIANFFDDRATAFYKKLGITRNIYKDYQQTDDLETDTKNYKNTYSEQFSENADTKLGTAEDRTTTDENGNTTTEQVAGESVESKDITGETPAAKSTSYIQSVASRVSDGLSTTEVGCAVLKIGTMVSIAVSTYEMYQSIHQFMLEMEQVSKTMDGKGANAALNAQNNEWTRETTTTYLDIETGEEKSVTGSPLQSEGFKSTISGEPINKAKVKNYSTERSLLATFTALGTSQLSTAACSTVSAANAVVSLATLAVPGSGFVKIAIGAIKQVAVAATLQIAISGIVAALVPIVAQALFTNPADLTGIPKGEQLIKGASSSAYLTATANSAFTPTSKERALATNHLNQTIIAQEAEQDRLTRSPLDISSPNTFLGSIVAKVAPITNSDITSSFVKLSSLTSSSILPTSFADGENSNYLSTFGDCPTAEEQGMASDAYCIPTTSSDLSTIDLEDNDPTYATWLANNVSTDNNGNQTVIPGSFLAEFIELVAGRESLPGNYDSGIADRALEYLTGDASSIAENIPYISDVLELVSFANNEEVEAWARGTICKNSPDNPRWDSDCKYAQHYIQKSRILNQIGYYDDTGDPIATFQSQSSYLNPTDTSRVAVFSRLTGLSRDDADFTLALLDYTSFLSSYNPEDTYQFGDNKSIITEQSLVLSDFSIKPSFAGHTEHGSAFTPWDVEVLNNEKSKPIAYYVIIQPYPLHLGQFPGKIQNVNLSERITTYYIANTIKQANDLDILDFVGVLDGVVGRQDNYMTTRHMEITA